MHITNMLQKTGCHSRLELAVRARHPGAAIKEYGALFRRHRKKQVQYLPLEVAGPFPGGVQYHWFIVFSLERIFFRESHERKVFLMKRTRNKALSLLLALLLALSLLPGTALAASTISSVSITLDAPEDGSSPD